MGSSEKVKIDSFSVAEELITLGDKYKAPILIVLGDMFSVVGLAENAEKMYLEALNIYKKLAKQYYKIYLPDSQEKRRFQN